MEANNTVLKRRMAQFADRLENLRMRWEQRESDCHVIFEDYSNSGAHYLAQKGIPVEGFAVAQGARADYRKCDNFTRFVQFLHHGDGFYLELPSTTLSKMEARSLVATRRGFYLLSDDPQSQPGVITESRLELIVKFDPVHKDYGVDAIAEAASDLAFLWFDFWNFPTITTFKATTRFFEYPWCEAIERLSP